MSEYDFATKVPDREFYIHQEPCYGGTATVVISETGIIDTPSKFDSKYESPRDKLDHYATINYATKLTPKQYWEWEKLVKDFFNKVREENGYDPHSPK